MLLNYLIPLFLCLSLAFSISYQPVVLIHGILDTNKSMTHMRQVIEQTYPGIYVIGLNIGSYEWPDSLFFSMNKQVKIACEKIKSDPHLAGQYINILGVSQGGLIARGYMERCNDPPVTNFISWVSPQGGQFGVPTLNGTINDLLEDVIECCIYDHYVQQFLSFPSYWKDPFKMEAYYQKSEFLADIDNSRTINEDYKKRVLSLKKIWY